MRIGIFTDTYLPDINGVASSSHILRNELVKHGHEVLVVTTEIKKGVDYEDDPHVYRLSGIELKKLYDYRLASFYSVKAMKVIKEMDLDVIHVQTEFSVGIFGKIAANILNIPVIYTYHTQYEDYVHYAPVIGKFESAQPLLKKAVSKISQLYGDGCTELIVPSLKTKEILDGYGVENDMHVIPTGLELDRFEKSSLDLNHLNMVKNECGLNHDDVFSLIFLGRVAPEKSIDMIIDALYILKERNNNVRLVIVGGGPGLDDLKDQAEKLGLSQDIYFAGAKLAKEVPYYYHACQVFVSASVSETQGLTYIEAMAAGLPVLARYDKNLDGIINDGKNGFFFHDEKKLADCIEKIMQMDLSALKTQAYLDSRQYSSENFYQKVINVYQEAIIHKHYTYKIGNISLRPNNMCEVTLKIDHQSISLHLPANYVLKHQLENGQVIEQEEFQEMQTYEFVFKGYKKALKYLTTRDYTKKQMEDKLSKVDNLNSEHIGIIVELLEDHHLIDDEAYANNFVRRASKTGIGIRKAILKLKEKGINDDILAQLRENHSRELEVEKAKKIAKKVYQSNKSKSRTAMMHALRDKLFYNGFEADVIDEAMNSIPYEFDERLEKAILEKEYDKALKKYARKYQDRELENKIFVSLGRKGFTFDMIKEVIEERNERQENDD